jgi:hypothetical protein
MYKSPNNHEQSVVDTQLKVHDAKNLRSVIPVLPECSIQNSVYMIGGEVRSSEMVLCDET